VAHDLHFDFEQHEEYRADEIVGLLQRVGHPRVNALFDFGNMLNAGEEPLDALATLAPYIRQVHVKGARRLAEDGGYAQLGVLQGAPRTSCRRPGCCTSSCSWATRRPR
jgi:sugar phosphate isomerase/epimerase